MTTDDSCLENDTPREATGPTSVIPEDVRRDRLSGVFSTQSVSSEEAGRSTRETIRKTYFFAEQMDGEGAPVVLIQGLNENNIPSGPKETVVLDDFLQRYSPELEYYQHEVFPKLQELNQTIKRAEGLRDERALYSAQFEFEAAIDLDENNVRANFGLGLTYMDRGETAKAADLFKRIVKLDAAFSPEHKHLFNEFGISLRKSGLLDQAVDYYLRALRLTNEDEHLHYNIARAYHAQGDLRESRSHLDKGLRLNPEFEEALRLKAVLEKRG